MEKLTWQVEIGESSESREAKNRSVYQEIRLPVTLAAPLAAGQHVFPFALPLPVNLPGSFIHEEKRDASWGIVEAQVTYSMDVALYAKGHTKPQTTLQPLTVYAAVMMPSPPRQPVQANESKRVKFFCCFDKGTCEISVTMNSDKYDLNTGEIDLQASVVNGTTLTIRDFYVTLRRELDLHVPTGYGHSGSNKIDRILWSQSYETLIVAGTKKDGIPLQLPMAKVMSALSQPGKPGLPGLRPTERLLFSSVSYHLAVKVIFTSGMCTVPKVELPVALLHLTPTGWIAQAPVSGQ